MSDPLARMKFCLHRFAHTTEEAQAINAIVDREVAALTAATPTTSADLDAALLGRVIEAWYRTPVNLSTSAARDSANWIIGEYRRRLSETPADREARPPDLGELRVSKT